MGSRSPFLGSKKKKCEPGYNALISNKLDFSKQNLIDNNLISNKANRSNEEYSKLIIDIAVYWIYRIRCSIAHNRIGEYVMSIDDEEFVVNVVEPLLKEVLIQLFKKKI